MIEINPLVIAFVVFAFLFQIVLIIHFALRKWHFSVAMQYGPIVYALSLPAAALSVLLLVNREVWSLWTGGLIFLVWGIFGYWIEYVQHVEWRDPIRWPILVPYVFLYLATVMFYWWPLALIARPLWYIYAAIFVVSTILNVTSHRHEEKPRWS